MNEPALFLDDDDRYSRLRLIGWWDQDKLAQARILIVGAGALGNEVLKNLALLGAGHLWIVDCDAIEQSNLTRSVLFRSRDCGRPKAEVAAEVLRELNPDIRVTPLVGNVLTDVGLGLFRAVDVVIGCLDNREARLWVNRQCWKVGTPWIDGGIQEINGVMKVFVPPDSACYECAMTENDYRLINLRYSCPLLRREDLLAGKVPTAPTISSVVGGWQVQEALKLIHGLPVEAGVACVFNGVTNQFYKTAFQRRESCLSHESYGPLLELELSAHTHTARELLAAVNRLAGGNGSPSLCLDRDLVTAVHCVPCATSRWILKPRPLVSAEEARCPRCGETSQPEFVHEISAESEWAHRRLAELGAAPYDILRVSSSEREHFVLLAGDRPPALP